MSNKKLDFHLHSLFSDGSETVDCIFKMAAGQGVKALALADHDTVLGIPLEAKAGLRYGIPYIPAAEFTVKQDGINFHILGYGINEDNTGLQAYSHELLDCMNCRSMKQIKLMQDNGIDIDTDEFFTRSGGGPLYRAKLLGVLSDFGYLEHKDIMKLLPEYFAKGRPYYMEDTFAYRRLTEITDMIHQSGGIAVLAHPAKIKSKSTELYYKLLQSPLIDGVEVYHPQNTEDIRLELLAAAEKREFVVTGGTDYHGYYMNHPLTVGDVSIPGQCLEALRPYLRGADKFSV